MLKGATLEYREQSLDIGKQNVRRLSELHRQTRIEDVRRRHALMEKTSLLADMIGDPGQERDDIVFRDGFDSVDGGNVDRRSGGPPIPYRFWCRCRDRADLRHRIERMRLDFKPDAVAVFGGPDCRHRRPGIAFDHEIAASREETTPQRSNVNNVL